MGSRARAGEGRCQVTAPIDPRSFALGALLGPLIWAFAGLTAFIILAFVGELIERLVGR